MKTMPIAFWASFDPWATAMYPADRSCNTRNPLFTTVGRSGRTTHVRMTMRVNPQSIPASGDRTRALSVLTTPCDETSSHRAVPAGSPLSARWHQTAPTIPPIRACDELDGMPKYQVNRFQAMAPTRAPATTTWVIVVGSAIPLEMVVATLSEMNAPAKLHTAASNTAVRPGSTPVDTTVATALAVSWNPLT